MPFVNIVYQAELNRFEDQEFEELARRNCNEDPDTRGKIIEELRTMIYERGECNPRRIDDAYCLRFLRCRAFIPALAHRLMARYEQFRFSYPDLYDCDPFKLGRVKGVYSGTLPESPTSGRIILMRLGNWDAETISATDIVRAALFMIEVAIMQPKLQILGITVIVDMKGMNLRKIRQVTPTIAHQIVSLMGLNFPLPLHGLHLINYNWFLNTFFHLFKRFIPKAALGKIHFHGSDMNSLHQLVDPGSLPQDHGGYCRSIVIMEDWIDKINLYKDDFLIKELKDLGYRVNNKSYSFY